MTTPRSHRLPARLDLRALGEDGSLAGYASVF
jgi:hypothetical protein